MNLAIGKDFYLRLSIVARNPPQYEQSGDSLSRDGLFRFTRGGVKSDKPTACQNLIPATSSKYGGLSTSHARNGKLPLFTIISDSVMRRVRAVTPGGFLSGR